jgi:hypothetical protein
LASAIVTQWLVKSAYEALATPLTYAAVNFPEAGGRDRPLRSRDPVQSIPHHWLITRVCRYAACRAALSARLFPRPDIVWHYCTQVPRLWPQGIHSDAPAYDREASAQPSDLHENAGEMK